MIPIDSRKAAEKALREAPSSKDEEGRNEKTEPFPKLEASSPKILMRAPASSGSGRAS